MNLAAIGSLTRKPAIFLIEHVHITEEDHTQTRYVANGIDASY